MSVSATLATARPWIGFLGRRLLGLASGVLFLLVVTFLMIHLIPGDPVRASLGPEAQPYVVEQRRAELHLDRPLPTQFAYYVGDLARLDFGSSIMSGEPVSTVIKQRLPNTAELAAVALVLVLVISLPVGLLVGIWTRGGRRRGAELAFTAGTGTVTAIPEYLMGTLLVAIFAVSLGVLPSGGKAGWESFVLPALALALAPACFLARVVRLETVSVLASDYITTARGKRLPGRVLYLRHAMPNVMTGALTIAGVIFGTMLGGSVIIENIFGWPGIGTTVVGAILAKDYPMVQACVLVLGLLVLVVNTLVDVLLVVVNPRLATLRSS